MICLSLLVASVATGIVAAKAAEDTISFWTNPDDETDFVNLTVRAPGNPFKHLFFYPDAVGNYKITDITQPPGPDSGPPGNCGVIAGVPVGHDGIGCKAFGSTEVATIRFRARPLMAETSQSKLVLDNVNTPGARQYLVVGPEYISCAGLKDELYDAKATLDDLERAASDNEAIFRALRDATFAEQNLYDLQHPSKGGGPHVFLGSHGPDFTRAVAEAQAAERALSSASREWKRLPKERDAAKEWVAYVQAALDDCLNGPGESSRVAASMPTQSSAPSAAAACDKEQAAVAAAQARASGLGSILGRLQVLRLGRAQAGALDAARRLHKLAASAGDAQTAKKLTQASARESRAAAGLAHAVQALNHVSAASASAKKALSAAQHQLATCRKP